MVFKNQ